MPRRKRSEREKPARQEFTPTQEASMITWQTFEKERFHCPLCSMMADVDFLPDAPFQLDTWTQRFGGKLPNGKGYIQYFENAEEDTVRLAAQMIPIVEDVLRYLRELAGEQAGEVEALQAHPQRPTFEPEPMPVYEPEDYADEGEMLETEELRELAAERARKRLAEGRGRESQKRIPAPATTRALLPGQKPQRGLKPGRASRKGLPPGTEPPKGLPPGRK